MHVVDIHQTDIGPLPGHTSQWDEFYWNHFVVGSNPETRKKRHFPKKETFVGPWDVFHISGSMFILGCSKGIYTNNLGNL